MTDKDNELLRLIGLSVVSAVLVEQIFVIAAKLAFEQKDVVNKSDIKIISKSKDFSVTFGNHLKKLLEKQVIDIPLADKLTRWNGTRHDIVHLRNGYEHIFSGGYDKEKAALLTVCENFCQESKRIAGILGKEVAEFMRKFPELKADGQKHWDAFTELTD